MTVLADLQDRYNRLITDSDTIRAPYDGDPRKDMGAEERARWKGLLDEADGVWERIQLTQREDALKAAAAQPIGRVQLGGTGKQMTPREQRQAGGDLMRRVKAGVVNRWDAYAELASWDDPALRSARAKQTWDQNPHYTDVELKALQANTDTMGGTLVMTEQFRSQIIIALNAATYVRQMATVIPMDKAESLGVPTMTADVADLDWTSELATGNADTALTTGKRALSPHPLAKRILVSNKLLRQASVDPEGLVRDRLAYKAGITQEKAFLLGSGSQQPLGVFTASADGISTGQDYAAASTTALVGEDFIGAFYKLRPPYWANAVWIIHPKILGVIRALKSTTGAYIWASGLAGVAVGGLAGAAPGTLVDRPYMASEYAPSTQTAGLYVAILGDFSYYWIADALDFSIQRLIELYAATNQSGFIARMESDGAPILGEAFVRLAQHA